MSYMPLRSVAPLMMSMGTPKSRVHSVISDDARQMRARGLAADIDAVRIAAERTRVLVDPGDAAPDLLGHLCEIAARGARQR